MTDLEATIQALYPATEQFWREQGIRPELGFKILNGPPRKNAPILFIGYQPGGDLDDWKLEKDKPTQQGKGTHQGWPKVCEYATQPQWRLVERLQCIFKTELLERCVGTNAIFLRYKDDKQYARTLGRKRKVVEQFCRNCLQEIVDAIQPQRIVVIGFTTLAMFGPTLIELPGARRTLIKSGKVFGRSAVGLLHLSSRWGPSDAELKEIVDYFKKQGCDRW